MFSIISFIIKIAFSISLSLIFCISVYNEDKDRKLIFNSILITVISTSIVANSILFSKENISFVILISLFIMFLLILKLYKDFNHEEKLYFIILSILGTILGSGYIFIGIIFLIIIITLFLYLPRAINNFLDPIDKNKNLD